MKNPIYIVKFEQFFDGSDIEHGLQSLDNRYFDKKSALEVAELWHSQFPKAKVKVLECVSTVIYDSEE